MGTVLTGITFVDSADVTSSDTILEAAGKLQAQLTEHDTALAAKQSNSNLSTDGTFASPLGTTYPSSLAVKTYVDAQTAGLLQLCGGYDASTNLFPTTGGTGVAGAVAIGDTWYVITGGTLGTKEVVTGDGFFANVNAPGQTASNWTQFEANAGFTTENVANKDTDVALTANSDTKYPSQKAVKAYADTKQSALLTSYAEAVTNAVVLATDTVLVAFGKLQKQITDLTAAALTLASFRYVEVANATTSYTVLSSDVTERGNRLVVLTNAASIACTLGTPTSLGKSVGDSVNIIQGGAGIVTVTAGTLVGASTTGTTAVYTKLGETKTFVAVSSTSWRVIGA